MKAVAAGLGTLMSRNNQAVGLAGGFGGRAITNYCTIVVEDRQNPDAAWYYPNAKIDPPTSPGKSLSERRANPSLT
jgi:hypothetical protein